MKYYHPLCLLVFIILCNKCFGCLENEKFALLELKSEILEISKNAYYPDLLSTWDDEKGSDCCAWDRVVCNNTTRQVIQLSLSSILGTATFGDRYGISAFGDPLNVSLFIPFKELQHLDLSFNSFVDFEGDLDGLSKLKKLYFLDLGWNNFNNSFLPSLGALASLRTLNISSNDICHGSATKGFDVFLKLQNLEELVLWDNGCNNKILPFLGLLKSLKVLNFGGNYLGGSLSELSQAGESLNVSLFIPFKELQHLDLSYNSLAAFEGDLDGLSKLKKLYFLDLRWNNFNNSFLPSLGALASLRTLDISDNDICQGSATKGFDVFFKLQKLEELVSKDNRCNHKILPFLPTLKSLKKLDLSYNKFEESLSELIDIRAFQDWKNTSKLKALYLGGNNFSQGIPPSILTLNSLRALSLPRSNLNGPLSSGLCDLKNLRDLDLSDNKFDGNLSPCFNNLTALKLVDFSNNQLHIPSSLISDLKSLEFLSLSGNQIDGTLPFTSPLLSNQFKFLDMSNCNLNISTINLLNFLHNQYDLRFLDLSHNNLYGSFPNWLVKNNTRLEALDLRNNSLNGSIQLGVVDSLLSHFDVSNNRIEGMIQKDIGVIWSKLEYLDLSKNNIEGSLPTSLSNIRYLSYLNLSKNNIEGTLPTLLGTINDLTVLDFSSNKLSGEIPECWGHLIGLIVLILSNNRLHGQISSSLLNLTNLFILRLSNNQFTGTIPNHNVGHLRDLKIFDLSQNLLSGRIPSWIGQSSPYLATLNLRNNSFHGSIPIEFCNSSSMQFLDLSHNHLSGSLPACLNLTSLKYMHLQENKFFASIPKCILQCSNLITLDLRHNNISGNIPMWFGFLKNLRILLLKGNYLKGSIPRQLCQLTKISILDLSNNAISGSIPPCFSNITFGRNGSAEPAFVSENTGTGSISHTMHYGDILDKMVNLYDAFYSFYSEQEEVEFMTKSRSETYKGGILNFMFGMDLSCNNITGDIPPELEALIAIRALNLSHNQLTGSIPSSLSKLKQLESMDLSYNSLTGEIPSELIDINSLAVFTVAHNNLTGRIPYMKAQFSTFGETSYEGNLFLCGPPLQHQCNTIRDPVTSTIIGRSEKLTIDDISFIASFVASYIVCLLGFVVVLFINPYWRRMWFTFIDACLSFMFPFWLEEIYK